MSDCNQNDNVSPKDLSTFIKNVHRSLREQVKKSGNAELVWSDHCRNESGVLTLYSEAMRHLGTDVWPRQHKVTRIDWCVSACQEYFLGLGLQRVRDKANRRRIHLQRQDDIHLNSVEPTPVAQEAECQKEESCVNADNDGNDLISGGARVFLPFKDKIRLLDVGSCYDPFREFSDFLAVGIDICPAAPTVYKCDFLRADIVDPLPTSPAVDSYFDTLLGIPATDRHAVGLDRLVAESFHVVVFSLLLEYLPTSRQRVLCCQSAWRLLAVDGLLVVVTPDSRRQHRNGRVATDWRRDVESIGFARWRYEKLEHVHCMAFRKVVDDEGEGRRRLVPGSPSSVDALRIPQDRDLRPGENGEEYGVVGVDSTCRSTSDEQSYEQLVELLAADYCDD